MKDILRLVGSIEEIARIQRIVAEIFVDSAVESIGSRFGNNIDSSAGVASEFCLRAIRHGNFLQGVQRQDGGWSAEHTPLINRRQIAITVVHVGAVEQVVVGTSTIAIDAEEAKRPWRVRHPRRISARTGNHDQQLGKITTTHRQFLDLPAIQSAA